MDFRRMLAAIGASAASGTGVSAVYTPVALAWTEKLLAYVDSLITADATLSSYLLSAAEVQALDATYSHHAPIRQANFSSVLQQFRDTLSSASYLGSSVISNADASQTVAACTFLVQLEGLATDAARRAAVTAMYALVDTLPHRPIVVGDLFTNYS